MITVLFLVSCCKRGRACVRTIAFLLLFFLAAGLTMYVNGLAVVTVA